MNFFIPHMKKIFNSKLICFCAAGMLSLAVQAGNNDRAGQAGANEILINPWARSSGMAGANSAYCKGLEAQFLNVAGTAFTKKTEMLFVRTNMYSGSGIHLNSFGFTQKAGETGALSLGLMSMDFGDIPITTTELPEGGLGNFHPQYINLGLSYAKGFSDNSYGGITLKGISEAISNLHTRGIALDAGIQYVTGPYDNVHFGIALKNVGPKMRYAGDGVSKRATPINASTSLSMDQRVSEFELPSLVNVGGAYDMYFAKDSLSMKNHRVTLAANFTSNTYSNDEFKVGLEYAFRNMLMLRAGYNYEKGITTATERTTIFTGPTAGFTLEVPFGKNKSSLGLDYSYRHTDPFQGVHSVGVRMNL